jgi:hypothetical protein
VLDRCEFQAFLAGIVKFGRILLLSLFSSSLPHSGLDVDKVLEYFNVEASTIKKGASTFAISQSEQPLP